MITPRVVSLYTGAGGLDLGFIDAGARIVFANEFDAWACQTYDQEMHRRGLTHTSTCMSVDDIDLSELDDVDIVIGGPPCQAFSVAGKMDPNDDRVRHVFAFMDVVQQLDPQVFVMENVLNLASNPRFEHIRQQLKQQAHDMGYRTQLLVLNADEHGTPQRRQRMFLIGRKHGSQIEVPTTRGTVSVRQALRALPAYGSPGNDTMCTAKITPAANPVLRKSPFAGMLFNGAGRPLDLDKPSLTLPASMGGNRTHIIDQAWLEDPNHDPWVIQYHQHLTAGGEPVQADQIPRSLRRLTVQEAAALQGFPADMSFAGPTSVQFRQIGNAVPVPLARAVARGVLAHLNR